MNRLKQKATSLSEWLEIATGGLAASGKERIEREIRAHYAEAVAAHLAHGEIEQEAEANAIVELGDATVAAKRFHKKHLTEKEATVVQGVEKESGRVRTLVTSLLFIPFFPFVLHPLIDWTFSQVPASNWLCLVATFAILPTVSFLTAHRGATMSNLSRLLIVGIFFRIALAEVFFLFYRNAHNPITKWFFPAFILFQGRHLVTAWIKVRKSGDAPGGTPKTA